MIITKALRADDAMEICFHQFLNEIYLRKLSQVGRPQNVEDRYDIFMVKVTEKLYFTQGPEAEHGMIERGDAFDCNFTLSRYMDC